MYMFIDESGDMGQDSDHIVFVAICYKHEHKLRKCITKTRRRFYREFKNRSEFHAYEASDEAKFHLIRQINKIEGIYAFIQVLVKKEVHSPYLQQNPHKLYNYVCGRLAEKIELDNLTYEIIVDKSKGKQLLRSDFDNYFSGLLQTSGHKVYHEDSSAWGGLQIADLVAWSFFRKFERGDSRFVDEININYDINNSIRKKK